MELNVIGSISNDSNKSRRTEHLDLRRVTFLHWDIENLDWRN